MNKLKSNMKTKLVSLTAPVMDNKIKTPEDLIVYTARVSNPSNQENLDTAPKLLAFLIRKKHWSPFEMVDMTVEIQTSRAISAQIIRHSSNKFQEFSQRYAEIVAFEPIELRKNGSTDRQSSLEVFDPILEDCGKLASEVIKKHLNNSRILYKSLLKAGVAKECARMVLPLTTQTTLYMKGSIRSWIHYLQVRCDKHTQKEHRLIADSIREIFKQHFPHISTALNF